MKKIILINTLSLILLACGAKKTASSAVSTSKPETISPEVYAQTITMADLKKELYIYASDRFEGRETGKPGQKLAVNFLRDHYKKLNIPAAKKDGDYFQKVPLKLNQKPKIEITIDSKIMKDMEDFISVQDGNNDSFDITEIVYADYGIEDAKFSSYTGLDVENKVVLIKSGEPITADGNYVISGNGNPSKWSGMHEQFEGKLKTAKDKGAKMVLFYFPEVYDMVQAAYSSQSSSITLSSATKSSYMLLINDKIAKELLPDITTNNKPQSIKTNMSFGYKSISENIDSENVAAFIKGSEKPDEVIVLSAHLDHEGIKEGKVYNGADDDGSGTVAIIEIAEAFAKAVKDGHRPKRSILFLNVTGEEKGLLGSKHYTDNDPIFPLENTVANLNIDMIGRIDPKRKEGDRNYIYLIGSDKLSTELHNISEEVNKKYANVELDYTYNDENDPNRFYYRSDHYNFAKNNIPIIFYFNGTHDDYHQPTDTADKIEYDLLENRTRLVFYTAWELANREKRIVVDKAKKE